MKVKKRKQETKKLKPYEDSDSVEDDTKEEPIIEEGGIRELDDDEDEGDAVIDNVDDYADHTSDEDDIMSVVTSSKVPCYCPFTLITYFQVPDVIYSASR